MEIDDTLKPGKLGIGIEKNKAEVRHRGGVAVYFQNENELHKYKSALDDNEELIAEITESMGFTFLWEGKVKTICCPQM